MTCDKCGHALTVGEFPFCPHGTGSITAIGDDIPGGLLIEHGLCHADGTPQRFYTKSAIAQEAKRRGLNSHVRHIDGSPHTRRWI